MILTEAKSYSLSHNDREQTKISKTNRNKNNIKSTPCKLQGRALSENHDQSLSHRIQSCTTKNKLFSIFRSSRRRFSSYQWKLFINKTAFFMDKDALRNDKSIGGCYINVLENIARMNLEFKTKLISKMIFMYGIWFQSRCTQEITSYPSKVFEDYSISVLDKNISRLNFLDIYWLSVGLKAYSRTPQLDQFISKLCSTFQNGHSLRADVFAKLVASISKLSYGYGLMLWGSLDLYSLDKDTLFELLQGVKVILPLQKTYISSFDFSALMEQIKKHELTDYEFFEAFVAITVCDYGDEEWCQRAQGMLDKGLPEDFSIPLNQAMEHQQQNLLGSRYAPQTQIANTST